MTTLEDTDHVFDHSEFNFYDPDDPTSDLTSITITGLPSTGKLFIDGVELTGDNLATLGTLTKADIDADKLVFRPNPDENGDDYATFIFTVSDGLASSAAATMTLNSLFLKLKPPLKAKTLPVYGSMTTAPPFIFGSCSRLK